MEKNKAIVILAAGQGKRLGDWGKIMPKGLLPLRKGQTLLGRLIGQFSPFGDKVVVVTGHRHILLKEYLADRFPDVLAVYNEQYQAYSNALSLKCALERLDKVYGMKNIAELLILDGDSYISYQALTSIFQYITAEKARDKNMIFTTKNKRADGEWNIICNSSGSVVDIDLQASGFCDNTTAGILHFTTKAACQLYAEIDKYIKKPYWDLFYYEDLSELNLFNCSIEGNIHEVDRLEDIENLYGELLK